MQKLKNCWTARYIWHSRCQGGRHSEPPLVVRWWCISSGLFSAVIPAPDLWREITALFYSPRSLSKWWKSFWIQMNGSVTTNFKIFSDVTLPAARQSLWKIIHEQKREISLVRMSGFWRPCWLVVLDVHHASPRSQLHHHKTYIDTKLLSQSGRGRGGASPRTKNSQFQANFSKFWHSEPPGGLTPLLGESWIHPCRLT